MSLLSTITKKAPVLPSRVVVYATEKFGKTSFGCFAPHPVFLMTAAETGLLSLLESGQVPPTDHFPDDFRTWDDLRRAVRELRDQPHDFKVAVIDTGNGAENLCCAHVCEENFGGCWMQYADYGKGNEAATKEWGPFLRSLDELRSKRKMGILILQHARVKSFNNPSGKDWDQWRPESVDKLWSLTHKWADVIAYGGFKVSVKQDKAINDEAKRYLRTQASASIVAGNRYGMREEITAAPGAANLWKEFAAELQRAKSSGHTQAMTPTPEELDKAAELEKTKQNPPEPTGAVHSENTDAIEPNENAAPPEEHGDAYEEPPQEKKPSEDKPAEAPQPTRITTAQMTSLVKLVKENNLTWPKVRSQLNQIGGFEADKTPTMTDLSSDAAQRLIDHLSKPKAAAA